MLGLGVAPPRPALIIPLNLSPKDVKYVKCSEFADAVIANV
jgi:hypothetical protein